MSKIDRSKLLMVADLIDIAIGLKSGGGVNTEYDRALVEMIVEAAGLPAEEENAKDVARSLGIDPANFYR